MLWCAAVLLTVDRPFAAFSCLRHSLVTKRRWAIDGTVRWLVCVVQVCGVETADLSQNPCGYRASAALLTAVEARVSLATVMCGGWDMPPELDKRIGA